MEDDAAIELLISWRRQLDEATKDRDFDFIVSVALEQTDIHVEFYSHDLGGAEADHDAPPATTLVAAVEAAKPVFENLLEWLQQS